MPVGFGDARYDVDHEQRQQRQPVPRKEGPAAIGKVPGVLPLDDARHVERARHQQHGHKDEAHGQLVADHLSGRPHGAEKRILRVRRPAGDDHAVHADRGDCHHVQQAGVNVGQHQPGAERNDRPRRQRRHDDDDRCQEEQALVRLRRCDDFLGQQLEGIGDRLQQAERADAVRADANVHPADQLALPVGEIGHHQQDRDDDRDDLGQ
jgi:hypothetical protein